MRPLVAFLLPCLLLACQTVPYTGRSRMLLVSQSEEKKLGEQAYRDILKKAKVSNDRQQVDLLRKVGRRLAKVADRPDFKWEFSLIEDDKMINAFCLPGGKVAFYTGILPVTEGEDGIAVVMSHEIAHALARHGAERMSQGMIVNAGGQILGAAVGGKSPVQQKLYREFYAIGVGVGVMLPYSRKQESESDKIGLILMAKAGYDPAQALLFWKRMEQATEGKGSDSPLAKFMRTHPTSVDRQRQIQEWLPEIRAKYSKPE
ncbi:MAG: M48 family metallopeptidase [Elusimicrobiota bacterium]